MARLSALNVQIENKQYPDSTGPVLADLRFDAAAGEFLALVGPSGAGKSTLLNIIAGLDADVVGSVALNGQTLTNGSEHAQLRVAYVFQEPRLMPWLTVLENLLLVVPPGGDRRGECMAMLEAVGLAEQQHAFPNQLSGGMQRRCALARAFVVEPALLLMDEPFVSLDAPTADRLRGLLMKLWQTARPTILFVTHNLREALTMADRVLFMSTQPARVIMDFPVPLKRPRGLEDARTSRLQETLLRDHPELLSGDQTPDRHLPARRRSA